jgi:hypothetical protein
MKAMNSQESYLKANRKASREIEIEIFGSPQPRHKVHRSKKTYNRKNLKKAGRNDLLLLFTSLRIKEKTYLFCFLH